MSELSHHLDFFFSCQHCSSFFFICFPTNAPVNVYKNEHKPDNSGFLEPFSAIFSLSFSVLHLKRIEVLAQGRSQPGARGRPPQNNPPSDDEIRPLAFTIVIRKRKILKIKS